MTGISAVGISSKEEDASTQVPRSKTKELENHCMTKFLMKREETALQTDQVRSIFPKMCENVSHDVQRGQNDDKIHPSQDNEEEVCHVKESRNTQQKLCSESLSCEINVNQDSKKLKNKLDGLDQTEGANAENSSRKVCEEAIPGSGRPATLPNKDHAVAKIELPDGGVHGPVPNGKLISDVRKHAPVSNQEIVMDQRQSSDPEIQTQTSPKTQIHDSANGSSQFCQVSLIPKLEQDGSNQGQIPETEIHASVTYEGGTVSTALARASNTSVQCESTNPQASAFAHNQEKLTYSTKPEKTLYKLQPRRNPEYARGSQSEQPSIFQKIDDKALDDGYNWRKYGQKLVKRKVFIRSYYKCTYSNCLAKKQVQRSYDGSRTDIKYIGKHEHPKPQFSPPLSASSPPIEVKKLDMEVTAASEAYQGTSEGTEPAAAPMQLIPLTTNDGEVSQSQNSHDDIDDEDSPKTKKQRREACHGDDNLVKKTYSDARYVVQTISEVDIINDYYRWRKYGQKLVKGNPNPRSYYRCSNVGCPVKKHVERSSHDPKVVITTYEGKHDHDMPGSSSVSHISVGSDINRKTMSGESRSENKAVGMEVVVHVSAN